MEFDERLMKMLIHDILLVHWDNMNIPICKTCYITLDKLSWPEYTENKNKNSTFCLRTHQHPSDIDTITLALQ